MERVSVWLALFIHLRVSMPDEVQVAAWVTDQLPYEWPVAGIERLSFSLQDVQARTSVPAVMHVGAVVTVQPEVDLLLSRYRFPSAVLLLLVVVSKYQGRPSKARV